MSLSNQTSLSSILLPIQQKTLFGISWFYVTFGIFGCFLNILLFSQKQFRQISCCTFASIAMFTQLVIFSIPSIYAYYYFNPMSSFMLYCKIRMYIIQITSFVYRWSYTIASLDRYILSSSNARLRKFASVQIAIRVLLGIVLISLIYSVYIPFVYEIKSLVCSIFNNPNMTLFTSLSSIILGAFIPVLIMIICTLLTRKNLKEKRQRRQNLSIREVNQEKRDRQALRMLFVQILVFIIITLPWMGYSINNVISSYTPNKTSDRIAIENFITAVAGALAFLFPSLSFYLYTLTSSMFRTELILLIKVLIHWKCLTQNHRIEPTNTIASHRTPMK
ncbi:unnamed protein product [Adineta ricciae]|uniref:G-protein coupled receptors family 1 profile domain-containing protein n=1 Tax=Adineta ricciae TaxID=249248 RepID=A0A815A306_ADIRI|nr:unnamed protein product [Adineta ricciae]